MASSEIIVGLDIGTTKIAAIVGKRNEFDKIDILGYGRTESFGVKRGVVANIENTVQSIRQAIEKAQQESNVDIKNVCVGIAGQHIRSMQHHGSTIRSNSEEPITEEELAKLTESMYKLAMQPGEQIIEVFPQEYTIDGEPGVRHPKGMLGNKIEANFHIITAQILAAKNIFKCVKEAGLDISQLILQPVASGLAVLSEEEKEAGVALVDIGGGTTDLAIFHDGIIRYTTVIPLGGDVITEDVKEGCAIIRRYAEDLKVKFGSALATEMKQEEIVTIPGLRGRPAKEITLKTLASIIQARMEEIIGLVYNEILNSKLEKKLIAGIVLTGGGAQLKHLPQLTSFKTGMDARVGYPNEHLSNIQPEGISSPMYATGVGLVMIGINRSLRELNRSSGNARATGEKALSGGAFFRHIKKLFE